MKTRDLCDRLKIGSVVFSMAAAAWTLTDLSGINILKFGVSAQAKESTDELVHGYVNSECGLYVREDPDIESEEIRIIPFGTEVQGKEQDGWIQLEDGFIFSKYVQKEPPMELLGDWRVTAYASTGYRCANGEYPETGYTIAHNSLPFGTKVYIEDVGVRTVEDRGPEWLGSEWCDLYLGDTQSCIQWGDQTKTVWLVK